MPERKMPETKRQNERLIVMIIIGTIALNFPFLSLFSKVRLFLGIPVLYLYIFSAWVLFILCLALVLEKAQFPSLMSSPKKGDRSD